METHIEQTWESRKGIPDGIDFLLKYEENVARLDQCKE